MKRMLKNELYRAFANKRMLIVLIIETVFIMIYTISEVFPVYTHTLPFQLSTLETAKPMPYISGALHEWIALRHSSFSVILFTAVPLLAAIPYGDSLYVDEQSHYVNHYCIRENKKSYYFSKLISMFLSGGFAAAFPFILSFILNTALLPIEPVQVSSGAFFSGMSVFSEVFYRNPLAYVFIYIFQIFLVFGLLNCFCFVFADMLSTRFVVTIVPFTIYFASGLVGNFTDPHMAPWIYVKMQNMYKYTLWMVALQIVIAVMIAIGTCIYKSSGKTDVL